MAILARQHGRAANTANTAPASTGSDGPTGAPRASYVKEVLLTLRTRLASQVEDGGDDGNDPVMVRALQANIRRQIEQIDEALTRIEEGKYGVCANCLKPIEADRLAVRPYSTLCLECQNRQDRGVLARH